MLVALARRLRKGRGVRLAQTVACRRFSRGGWQVRARISLCSTRGLAEIACLSTAQARAPSRFDRDVLGQPGVRWVIFSDDPINDLGSTHPPPPPDALIAGIERLIARAHEKNIQFFCSTLPPQ